MPPQRKKHKHPKTSRDSRSPWINIDLTNITESLAPYKYYVIITAESAYCNICRHDLSKANITAPNSVLSHLRRVKKCKAMRQSSSLGEGNQIMVFGLKKPGGSTLWASVDDIAALDITEYPERDLWLSRVVPHQPPDGPGPFPDVQPDSDYSIGEESADSSTNRKYHKSKAQGSSIKHEGDGLSEYETSVGNCSPRGLENHGPLALIEEEGYPDASASMGGSQGWQAYLHQPDDQHNALQFSPRPDGATTSPSTPAYSLTSSSSSFLHARQSVSSTTSPSQALLRSGSSSLPSQGTSTPEGSTQPVVWANLIPLQPQPRSIVQSSVLTGITAPQAPPPSVLVHRRSLSQNSIPQLRTNMRFQHPRYTQSAYRQGVEKDKSSSSPNYATSNQEQLGEAFRSTRPYAPVLRKRGISASSFHAPIPPPFSTTAFSQLPSPSATSSLLTPLPRERSSFVTGEDMRSENFQNCPPNSSNTPILGSDQLGDYLNEALHAYETERDSVTDPLSYQQISDAESLLAWTSLQNLNPGLLNGADVDDWGATDATIDSMLKSLESSNTPDGNPRAPQHSPASNAYHSQGVSPDSGRSSGSPQLTVEFPSTGAETAHMSPAIAPSESPTSVVPPYQIRTQFVVPYTDNDWTIPHSGGPSAALTGATRPTMPNHATNHSYAYGRPAADDFPRPPPRLGMGIGTALRRGMTWSPDNNAWEPTTAYMQPQLDSSMAQISYSPPVHPRPHIAQSPPTTDGAYTTSSFADSMTHSLSQPSVQPSATSYSQASTQYSSQGGRSCNPRETLQQF